MFPPHTVFQTSNFASFVCCVLVCSLLSAARADPPPQSPPPETYVTTVDLDPTACRKLNMPQGQRINPFLSYTAIATDFGFLGPASDVISMGTGLNLRRSGGNAMGRYLA